MIRAALLATAILFADPEVVSGAPSAPANTPRVVNIATDSEPNWLPSEALEFEALDTVHRYFRALKKGDDFAAWNFSTDGFKHLTTFADFKAGTQKTRAELGQLRKLDIVKVTWTKDPAQAPAPGIYVAIDISGQFSKAKRHCGYVILFKADPADPFRLARIENNYFTDKAAKQIAKAQSPAEVERLWAKVSAHCPNYKNPFVSVK